MVPYTIEYIIFMAVVASITFLGSLWVSLQHEKMERRIKNAASRVEIRDLKTRAHAHVESVVKEFRRTVETENSGQIVTEIYSEFGNSAEAAKPNSESKET